MEKIKLLNCFNYLDDQFGQYDLLNEIDNIDYAKLLGFAMMNRMTGALYQNLKKMNILQFMPTGFEDSLEKAFYNNKKWAKEYLNKLLYVSKLLKEANFPYALTKGAYLISHVYHLGIRNSYDIDILINQEDIDKCQKLFLDDGFLQGFIENGVFREATRKENLMARLNYGEVVNLIKIDGDDDISIDLNFSIDYQGKEKLNIVREFLRNREEATFTSNFFTLNQTDFLIHLCCHLFKEASVYNWVKNGNDLSLYKFFDIYVILSQYDLKEYKMLNSRIVELGLERECYYAIYYSFYLFEDVENKCVKKRMELYSFLDLIRPADLSYLQCIIWPEKNKKFIHNKSFMEWFFTECRWKELKEI